jgi:hypothetical protein
MDVASLGTQYQCNRAMGSPIPAKYTNQLRKKKNSDRNGQTYLAASRAFPCPEYGAKRDGRKELAHLSRTIVPLQPLDQYKGEGRRGRAPQH